MIVLISFVLAPGAGLASGRVISFAFHQWKPMIYIDEKKEGQGVMADIAREVFEDGMGLKLLYNERPWSRAQLEVKNGDTDFIITVPTPERRGYALVSAQPFYSLSFYIYTYRGHEKLDKINRIKTAADIKDLNLVPVTNLGNGWHKQNIDIHGINTHYVGKEKHILLFLANRRADIMIDVRLPTDYLIKKHGLSRKIMRTQARFRSIDFHLILSRKSLFAKEMPLINQIFTRAKKEGRIDRILNKYQTGDTRPGHAQ